VDVVTPLVTDGGTALLVNRGWLETANVGRTRADVPAAPEGEVRITGWVRADAGDAPSAVVRHRSTRAISSSAIGGTVPFPVYGGFVELDTEAPAPAEPLAKAEPPDLGEGPHFFYGLQWWFFGALAVFGFGYLVWDERRRWRRDRAGPTADDADRAPLRG
jgi:cytochrome oxidase assembly protein ShyY1